jgi:hypothetical protein
MTHFHRLLILSLASLLLLAAGCSRAGTSSGIGPQPVVRTPEAPAPQNVASGNAPEAAVHAAPQQVSLRVNSLPSQGKTSFYVADGSSAVAILRKDYTITTKNFQGLGEFVESIDGIKPDGAHFWAFYVNGKSSTIGASSFVPKPGDAMEWKLDEIK